MFSDADYLNLGIHQDQYFVLRPTHFELTAAAIMRDVKDPQGRKLNKRRHDTFTASLKADPTFLNDPERLEQMNNNLLLGKVMEDLAALEVEEKKEKDKQKDEDRKRIEESKAAKEKAKEEEKKRLHAHGKSVISNLQMPLDDKEWQSLTKNDLTALIVFCGGEVFKGNKPDVIAKLSPLLKEASEKELASREAETQRKEQEAAEIQRAEMERAEKERIERERAEAAKAERNKREREKREREENEANTSKFGRKRTKKTPRDA